MTLIRVGFEIFDATAIASLRITRTEVSSISGSRVLTVRYITASIRQWSSPISDQLWELACNTLPDWFIRIEPDFIFNVRAIAHLKFKPGVCHGEQDAIEIRFINAHQAWFVGKAATQIWEAIQKNAVLLSNAIALDTLDN